MKSLDGQIYYLIHSLSVVRGGLTRNVLRRASLVGMELQQTIHILTFNYNPEYDSVRKELLQSGIINEYVTISNFFEFLARRKKMMETDTQEIEHPVEEEGLVAEKIDDENEYCLFQDGWLVKHKSYDHNHRIKFIDYYNENQSRTYREYFDLKGRLRRAVYMDDVLNKPRQSSFFDENGRLFLSNWYHPETGKSYEVYWFDSEQDDTKVFNSEKELKIYWLEQIAEKSENPLFQSEMYKTDVLLLGVKHPKVAKVKMMHSNHLRKPYTYGAPLMKEHKKILKQASQFDGMVFITEQQKKDIERQFGPRSIYHSVPHYAPKIASIYPVMNRKLRTAVIVSRFTAKKNLDHAIRAFSKVVDHVPDAILELWGFGPEEENLRQLIQKLGLESHVFIKGFAHDAIDVFKKAAFSVLPSSREGFGLVVAESMAAGTPVISYDVNYGPREMIINNQNGILVRYGDVDLLSESMIELFTDQKKLEAMSKEACKISTQLSEERFTKNWINVYKAVFKQKNRRVQLNPPQCRLTRIEWITSGVLSLEGKIQFEKEQENIGEALNLQLYVRRRDQLMDRYVPISIERTSSSTFEFQCDLALHEWIQRGIWDLYISCSAYNDHHFIRLAGKESNIPSYPRVLKNPMVLVNTYYTKYGNISLDIGLQKLENQAKKNLRSFFHKLAPS